MGSTIFKLIEERPLTGFGIDSFRYLYPTFPGGRETYSHNNFIEITVGTGIFGVIAYYLTHIKVLKDLYLVSRVNQYKTLALTFISIILAHTFLSIGLVYYYSKHFGLLLAAGSIIHRVTKNTDFERENNKT